MGLASPQVRVHVSEALTFVRALDFARVEASVNCVIKLNVEAKRTDERVRGMAFLPHGRGKPTRVAVFARGALADEATDAGADVRQNADCTCPVKLEPAQTLRNDWCPHLVATLRPWMGAACGASAFRLSQRSWGIAASPLRQKHAGEPRGRYNDSFD